MDGNTGHVGHWTTRSPLAKRKDERLWVRGAGQGGRAGGRDARSFCEEPAGGVICALEGWSCLLAGSKRGEHLGILGVASGWRGWGMGLLNLLLALAGVVLGSGDDQKFRLEPRPRCRERGVLGHVPFEQVWGKGAVKGWERLGWS